MTGPLGALLVALAAWVPPVMAERSPAADGRRLAGIVLGLVAVLVVAAFTGPIIDALDVSAPTLRTAAGAVVALVGARWLVGPPPRRDSGDGLVLGMIDAVTPSVVLAAMSTTAEDGWVVAALAAVVAAAVGVGLGRIGLSSAALAWLRRLVGGGAVAVGVALVYAGIRAV